MLLLNLMSWTDLYLIEKIYPAKFFSVLCVNTSRLKLNFEKDDFDDVRNKLVSAHCTVTSNVLTVTDENHKRCIFPILPVNVPGSYIGSTRKVPGEISDRVAKQFFHRYKRSDPRCNTDEAYCETNKVSCMVKRTF